MAFYLLPILTTVLFFLLITFPQNRSFEQQWRVAEALSWTYPWGSRVALTVVALSLVTACLVYLARRSKAYSQSTAFTFLGLGPWAYALVAAIGWTTAMPHVPLCGFVVTDAVTQTLGLVWWSIIGFWVSTWIVIIIICRRRFRCFVRQPDGRTSFHR